MWTRALMSSVSGAEGPAEVATEAGMLLPRVPSSCWKPREAAEVLAAGAAPAAAAADAEAAGAAFCEYACICWDQSKLPCIMRVSMNVRGNLNVKGTHGHVLALSNFLKLAQLFRTTYIYMQPDSLAAKSITYSYAKREREIRLIHDYRISHSQY